MRYTLRIISFFFILSSSSCTIFRNNTKDDGKIEVVFVQVNDVYEIAPLGGGKEGGMARVGSLKNKYEQKNPNTFLVMAGDFLSPSVYNSLQFQGRRIRGRQMVDAMNAAGVDIAVFGNHEFDINESELLERINESKFQWVSSNAFHKQKDAVVPFKKNGQAVPRTFVLHVKDADGTAAKIAVIGITLPFNKADYVSYTDPLQTAKEVYNSLKDSVDAVIAITHQLIEEDIKLANEIPGLAVVLGGHEHDRRFEKAGNVYITKAHANAKSAYVVKLKINKKKRKIKVDPELEYIDEDVPFDSATQVVVNKWVDIAEKSFASSGFDARKVVLKNHEPLDGRESSVRSMPTNLTGLIAKAMKEAAPQADVVLMNSGSIRVDDVLPMPVTEYDIIRTLPFGGGIREVEMKGSLLIRTLEQGRKNSGIGGFLVYNEEVSYDSSANTWKLNGNAIDVAKIYRVALTDFLLSGKEANMDFLNEKNPEVAKVYPAETSVSHARSDIRLALIRYLEKLNR